MATHTTRVSHDIAAPPTNVYDALLSADDVQQWMVPPGMMSEVHAYEPVEGGAIHISLTYDDPSAAGKSTSHTDSYRGRFETLESCQRVVQSIEFETDDPSIQGRNTITLTLESHDGGTRLTAVHEGLPEGIDPAANELGWTQSLDQLAALVETRKRGFR